MANVQLSTRNLEPTDVSYSRDLYLAKEYLTLTDAIIMQHKEMFGNMGCERGEIASKFIQRVIPVLQPISGYALFDTQNMHRHGWSYDESRQLYIDLTLDQFEKTPSGRIYVTPVDMHQHTIYRPFDSDYQYTEAIRHEELVKPTLDKLALGYERHKKAALAKPF